MNNELMLWVFAVVGLILGYLIGVKSVERPESAEPPPKPLFKKGDIVVAKQGLPHNRGGKEFEVMSEGKYKGCMLYDVREIDEYDLRKMETIAEDWFFKMEDYI